MCLLFLYINNDAGRDKLASRSNNNNNNNNKSPYKLILANNRDEIFDRPALVADFWRNAKHCYGGVDYQPGRQGGTWIAASSRGRMAATLNVMSRLDPIKSGRGHLIPDYLDSQLSTDDYIESIALEGGKYNLFNFVALENKDNNWNCQLYTNVDGGSKLTFDNGTHQFGNSLHYNKPWKKGEYGRQAFSDIIESIDQSDERTLQDDLLNLLSDETKNYPDEILECQSSHYPCGSAEKFSSIAVDLRPHARYGTRTKTIITVDTNNNCKYMEHTMVEPIPMDNIKWHTSVKQFKIDSY